MELRIRSLDTLRIQMPSPSSLQDLKEAIAEKISAVSYENLQLSVNRENNIVAASPHDSLQSLGISSGDVIFYTLNPNQFSREESTGIHVKSDENKTLVLEKQNPGSCFIEKTIIDKGQRHQPHNSDFDSGETEETLILVQEEKTMGTSINENSNVMVEKTKSIPCFLRKVFKEEVSNIDVSDYWLLIIVVHAVFLESGFVAFDSGTKKKINGFHLAERWASKKYSSLSVQYTVPDLLSSSGIDSVETVRLMFQTFGKYLVVHGSLTAKSNELYRLCLDKSHFVPSIKFMCLNCDSTVEAMDIEDVDVPSSTSILSHEGKVLEFWRLAKDRLMLPLLINLCEKTGLATPPCFQLLPTDLKLKILEFLPGVDVAKIGCVSSELKILSSNNDLWRKKVPEEFENVYTMRTEDKLWKPEFKLKKPFLPGVDVAKIGCVSSELKILSSINDLWRKKVPEEFENVDTVRTQAEHWKTTFVMCWKHRKTRLQTRWMPPPLPLPFGGYNHFLFRDPYKMYL